MRLHTDPDSRLPVSLGLKPGSHYRLNTMEDKTKTKYLLVKAKGGMGNCMLCAITGILYGQLTQRIIVVDWRGQGYTNDGSNTFSRFFTCPMVHSETVLPCDHTVRPIIWKGCLGKSMDVMMQENDPDKHSSLRIHRKYSVDVRQLNYNDDIVVFWYYTGRTNVIQKHVRNALPGFEELDCRQIIRKVLTEQMILHKDIREKIDDFKARYWCDNVIGLHIRYSDRKTDLAKYRKVLDHYLRRYPNARIFLATDSLQVSYEYHERYRNVMSTPKWFPKGEGTMHQNKSCTDKIENGIEALIDMYLLAECQSLVYSGYSTFSLISRILSSASQENITDIDAFNLKVLLKRYVRELLS